MFLSVDGTVYGRGTPDMPEFVFHTHQISQNGEHSADKTTESAQDQISKSHEQALNTLRCQNMGFLFQKADADHHRASNERCGVSNQKGTHNAVSSGTTDRDILPEGGWTVKEKPVLALAQSGKLLYNR